MDLHLNASGGKHGHEVNHNKAIVAKLSHNPILPLWEGQQQQQQHETKMRTKQTHSSNKNQVM